MLCMQPDCVNCPPGQETGPDTSASSLIQMWAQRAITTSASCFPAFRSNYQPRQMIWKSICISAVQCSLWVQCPGTKGKQLCNKDLKHNIQRESTGEWKPRILDLSCESNKGKVWVTLCYTCWIWNAIQQPGTKVRAIEMFQNITIFPLKDLTKREGKAIPELLNCCTFLVC